MKWDYRPVDVDSSRVCPSGVVYRPMATLGVRGSAGEAYLRALVDTGADHTVLPFSIATDIDAELFPDEEGGVSGISGHEIAIVPGKVELNLFSDGESVRWSEIIGFAKFASPDDECSVLGHAGCLEFFLAAFDGVERVLELTPRTSLPNST